MPTRTLGPKGGWIEGEGNECQPQVLNKRCTLFEDFREGVEPQLPGSSQNRNSALIPISTSGGLGPLQMVSEPDTESDVPARKLSPEGGGQEAVCQQGRWVPNGGRLRGPRTIGEGNEC